MLLFPFLLWGCSATDNPDKPAADSGAPSVIPLAWAADQPGPYRVGYRAWPVTYEPLPGESRTVTVNVWFPTEDAQGEPVTYGEFYPAGSHILGGAQPATPAHEKGWPVMAFSHGDRGYGGSAEYLMAHFASHGWVAVAPDHTDNLLWANAEPTPQGHGYHRPLDVLASLDALTADERLGQANTDSWFLTGHSRGTTTVWTIAGASFVEEDPEAWCPGCSETQIELFTDGTLTDERAVAALPLAGMLRASLFGDTGHRSVNVPVMTLTGSEDDVGQETQFERLDGLDYTWIEFEGGCHQTFTIGACSTLDTDEGWWLIQTYALATARFHLLDDRTAQVVEWVEGTQTLDARVSYARRTE
jgi:predicted dienelactone hydrolase